MEIRPDIGKIYFDNSDPAILRALGSVQAAEIQQYRSILRNSVEALAAKLAYAELTEPADEPVTWSENHASDHQMCFDHQLAVAALDGAQAELDLQTLQPYEAEFSD